MNNLIIWPKFCWCLKSNEILTYSPLMFSLDTSRSWENLNKFMKAEWAENCQILRNHMWFRKSQCTKNCCRLVYTETISKSFLCSFSVPIHPLLPIVSRRCWLSLMWPALEFCAILKRGSPASFHLLQNPNPALPFLVYSRVWASSCPKPQCPFACLWLWNSTGHPHLPSLTCTLLLPHPQHLDLL